LFEVNIKPESPTATYVPLLLDVTDLNPLPLIATLLYCEALLQADPFAEVAIAGIPTLLSPTAIKFP